MELAGATTDWNRILAWCDQPKGACDPPEMPILLEKFKLIKQQPDVQRALLRVAGIVQRSTQRLRL